MNDTTTPTPATAGKKRFDRLEPYARNGLLGIIGATALLLVGQYTGASAVASAMKQARMHAWASSSRAHAVAMAEFLACDNKGPELSKKACVARAAGGSLADELDEVTTTPQAAWEALPRPLRWFLN